jgi:small subunit ribosomal protein S15
MIALLCLGVHAEYFFQPVMNPTRTVLEPMTPTFSVPPVESFYVQDSPQSSGAYTLGLGVVFVGLAAASLARRPAQAKSFGDVALLAVEGDMDGDMDDAVSDLMEEILPEADAPPADFERFEAADGAKLDSLSSYSNSITVEAMREKYKMHENDSGSAQVQVAVLTARIAYLTKHMQENKKDYASLRGLTAMVTRRRKLLEYLLKEDLAEFKRITTELGIRTNKLLQPKLQGARGRRNTAL